jgi:hypothetical protein
MRKLVMTSIAGATIAAAVLAPGAIAGPGTTVLYDSTYHPLPGNVHSFGPEAYSFAEMGDEVALASAGQTLNNVVATLSSWGCAQGHWYADTCSTPTTELGSTFDQTITLNIYDVGPGDTLGDKIATDTQTFAIPYRPSDDNVNCPPSDDSGRGRWYDTSTGTCYHGLATTVTFNGFTPAGVVLPDKVIYGIAFNTTHYGYQRVGESASCYSGSGGCAYDSLNIGWQDVSARSASVGSDLDPSQFWVNQQNSSSACSSTPGTFSPEANTCGLYGETVPATPAVQFNAVTPAPTCPDGSTTKTGNINGNLTVPSGQSWCLDNAHVAGDVTVQKGASLTMINGSSSGHDVKGKDVKSVIIDHSTVLHDVVVSGATGPVSVTNSTIGHDLNLTGNKGSVTADSNVIGHDMNVKSNTGTSSATDNTVSHYQNCTGNSAFTGSDNSGTGAAAASCNTA